MFCLCSVLTTTLGLFVHFCDSVSYLSPCLNANKLLFYFDMSFDFPCYSWFVPSVFPTCCLLSSLPCVYIARLSSCPLLCPPLIVCAPRLFSSRLCPSFLRGLPLTPTVGIPDSSAAVIFVFLENCNIKAVFEFTFCLLRPLLT